MNKLKYIGTAALAVGAIYALIIAVKDPVVWVPLVLFITLLAWLSSLAEKAPCHHTIMKDLDEIEQSARNIISAIEGEHYHRLRALAYALLETVTEAKRTLKVRLDRLDKTERAEA